MKAKFIYESLNEAVSKKLVKMSPAYFNLPYNIPDDRFKNGLLISNTSRRSSKKRYVDDSNPKYTSKEEFFKNVSISQINSEIKACIARVLKFLRNNPYTGKTVNVDYEPNDFDFKYYLKTMLEEPDDNEGLGIFLWNIPVEISLDIDYDIYKNIPVFTFGESGLFYYYTIYTLEPNDVTGYGENQTYITEQELYDGLFAETIWRSAMQQLVQIGYQEVVYETLGYSNDDEKKIESYTNLNDDKFHPRYVYDPNWIKIFRRFISEGDFEFLNNEKESNTSATTKAVL